MSDSEPLVAPRPTIAVDPGATYEHLLLSVKGAVGEWADLERMLPTEDDPTCAKPAAARTGRKIITVGRLQQAVYHAPIEEVPRRRTITALHDAFYPTLGIHEADWRDAAVRSFGGRLRSGGRSPARSTLEMRLSRVDLRALRPEDVDSVVTLAVALADERVRRAARRTPGP